MLWGFGADAVEGFVVLGDGFAAYGVFHAGFGHEIAFVGAVDEDGRTPLHIATRLRYEKVVLALLNNGADIEAGLPYFTLLGAEGNETALTIAAYAGHETIVGLLLEHGALVNTDDFNPLFCASRNGNDAIVKLLLERGADLNKMTGMWRDDDECGCSTPLQIAAKEGHYSIVRILLDHGADVEITDRELQQTALHKAVVHNHMSIVHLLLDSGADVHATDHRQWQPLH